MDANNKYHIKIGEKINRLTCLSFNHIGNHNRSYFKFICECGKEKIILGSLVKSGNTKSCGCLSDELKRKRISNIHSEVTAIMLGYKRHAKSRGFIWSLSRDEVENIIFNPCNYCGSEPANKKKTKNSLGEGLLYSGIDRKDSNKNYTVNNCVSCCKICNFAKSNLALNQFHEWAKRIGQKAMTNQWT